MDMHHKPKDVFEQGVQGGPGGGFNCPSSLKARPDTSSLSDQESLTYAQDASKPGKEKGCFNLGSISNAAYVGMFLYNSRTYGAHGDQMQIISFNVISKSCWQTGTIPLKPMFTKQYYKSGYLVPQPGVRTPGRQSCDSYFSRKTQDNSKLLELALTV